MPHPAGSQRRLVWQCRRLVRKASLTEGCRYRAGIAGLDALDDEDYGQAYVPARRVNACQARPHSHHL